MKRRIKTFRSHLEYLESRALLACEGFCVVATDPPDQVEVSESPARIVVEFSDLLSIASVDFASPALQIDGINATSVEFHGGIDALAFGVDGGLGLGPHTVIIPAGAYESAGGTPLDAYSGQFAIISRPQVVTQPATGITPGRATLHGQLLAGGQSQITVAWGTVDAATEIGNWQHVVELGVRAEGPFTLEVTGLTADTTYFFQVHAANGAGGVWATNTQQFTTSPATPPVVSTLPAVDVAQNTASLAGEVNGTGDQPTQVLLYWGSSDGGTRPAAWDHVVDLGLRTEGPHSVAVEALTAGQLYYYRVYAVNLGGETWAASSVSFRAQPPTLPLVTTSQVTGLRHNRANLEGQLLSAGGQSATASFYWGESDAGTDAAQWEHVVELGVTGEGPIVAEVASLAPVTQYFYRVFAANDVGGVWAAATESFTTLGPPLATISEFMAANSTGLQDEDGHTSDWIEIYNPTDATINLEGWHLTDNRNQLDKWTFPSVDIRPDSFLVVFASKKDRATAGGQLHTNFQLSSTGEYLGLVRPDRTIENEFAPTYPPQQANTSYGRVGTFLPDHTRYFSKPTPGELNGVTSDLGPIITDITQPTTALDFGDPLPVTVNATALDGAAAQVTLSYRVMYGEEIDLAMFDDGQHADGMAGDGLFGATIPAGIAVPGDMLRYRVSATDDAGHSSRWPLFNDAQRTPEYVGTIIDDPIDTPLPVLHWFTEDVRAAASVNGARASVFFSGELYDNVFVRGRGAGGTGAGQKFEFNRGFDFWYADDAPRVREINTRSSNSELGELLAFELYRDAGSPASRAFPMRFQRNGRFAGVDIFLEHVDATYLTRNGLDENGALFKMFNSLTHPVRRSYRFYRDDNTKRTRDWDPAWDLDELVAGVSETNPDRAVYLMDNVNVPAMINYLAATVISGDFDHETHNYFVYRDNEGTLEWQFLPWDRNIAFGTAAIDPTSHPFLGSSDFVHPPWACLEGKCNEQWNRVTDLIYDTPQTREMYLRRLRTLMDELLQPPGTPAADLKLEARLDELAEILRQDDRGLAASASAIKRFVSARRRHLYVTHGIDNLPNRANGAGIPHAQVGNPPIQFGRLETNPASGNQDEEYIELTNPSMVAVDISGWRLTGGVEHIFPPGTVIPSAGRMFVSPNPVAFRARAEGPSGGQMLFVQGSYSGHLSSRGETVKLVARDGETIASVITPAEPSTAQTFLRITEVHYNPAGSSDATEFIELQNIAPPGDEASPTLDLAGVSISDGPSEPFTFGEETRLAPGEFLLVARDPTAFRAAYPEVVPEQIFGPFVGRLSNGGERLKLEDAQGSTIVEFVYGDGVSWPERADGAGASLQLTDPIGTPVDQLNKPYRWRASIEFGGSPGNRGAEPIGVVINEVLTNPDPPTTVSDAIELLNTTDAPVDVSGWYVSDSSDNLLKYAIPTGMVLQPGQFLLLAESEFNPDPPLPEVTGFALNGDEGDDVWVVIPDGAGGVATFVDDVHFGATAAGETLGRLSSGDRRLAPLAAATLGAVNSPARVGPLLISEVQYHPAPPSADALAVAPDLSTDDLEFIEIHNPTSAVVDLTDWRLRGGVEFDFPAELMIAPRESLLVVPIDPTDVTRLAGFRLHYGIDAEVRLVGGYQGNLNDGGERIQLQRPGTSSRPGVIPRLWEDEVQYDDRPPWPVGADGSGKSLQRISTTSYGNAPSSWRASPPSPGVALDVGDFSGDGRIDEADISLMCEAMHSDRAPFDLSDDGLVDEADLMILIESILGTAAGDATLDGVFNSADLVRIFQVGEYQDSVTGNSTWSEGDWNCDGDFDSGDLVDAFQAGNYITAATPIGSRVAAAVELLFADDEDLKSSRSFRA